MIDDDGEREGTAQGADIEVVIIHVMSSSSFSSMPNSCKEKEKLKGSMASRTILSNERPIRYECRWHMTLLAVLLPPT
jgi:hypothetical protein